MIPSQLIADLIQEKLGIAYHVEVDGVCDPQTEGIPTALYIARVPYAVDAKTEALNIRLEFYATTTTTSDKKYHNDNMAALLAAVNGIKYTLIDDTDTYELVMYLQSIEPINTNYDQGFIQTLYQVSGTAIATSSDSIFALGNEIELKRTSDSTYNTLKVINWGLNFAEQLTVQNKTSIEQIPGREALTRIYTIVFLADSSAICGHIESKAIGGGTDSLSDTYSLRIKKIDGTKVTRTVMLSNAERNAPTGGYVTYTISLRLA